MGPVSFDCYLCLNIIQNHLMILVLKSVVHEKLFEKYIIKAKCPSLSSLQLVTIKSRAVDRLSK